MRWSPGKLMQNLLALHIRLQGPSPRIAVQTHLVRVGEAESVQERLDNCAIAVNEAKLKTCDRCHLRAVPILQRE